MTKMQILTLALVFGLRSAAFSAVPDRINFQGRLLDSNKNPKNGTYSMTFRVCDSLAASCAGPLWTETQGSVSVTNGVFSIQLGDGTPLTSAVFGGDAAYLEIEVEGETLSPRERLVTSPYAYRAAVADVVSSSSSKFILNQETLQDGATFYVSSGTIQTGLRVGTDLKVGGTIITGSDALVITTAQGFLDAQKLTGLAPNASLDASSVTLQGNGFNGADQLVRLDGSGNYPSADGSAITNVDDATKLPLAGGTVTGAVTFGSGSSLDSSLAEIAVSTNLSVTGYVARYGFYYARRTSVFDNTALDTYTQFDLDTQDVMDTAFYSEAAGVVTIQKTGLYLVDSLCSFTLTAGTREDGQCAVFVNSAQRADLTCGSYVREAGRLGTSCSTAGILSLSAGDTVDLRMQGNTAGVDLGAATLAPQPATLRMEFVR